MSSRARVASDHVQPFDWGGAVRYSEGTPPPESEMPADEAPMTDPAAFVDSTAIAEIEQGAFERGYQEGQRAGAKAAAAAARQEAAATASGLVQRLAATIEQLSSSRLELIRRSERQLVELAILIAKQVLRREISLDRSLLVAMAHVALDRLSDCHTATIRLHPDDFAEVQIAPDAGPGAQVTIVADAAVERGGCLVECDGGWMSAGLDSQFNELTRALLGS